jgi:fatty acid desaturase
MNGSQRGLRTRCTPKQGHHRKLTLHFASWLLVATTCTVHADMRNVRGRGISSKERTREEVGVFTRRIVLLVCFLRVLVLTLVIVFIIVVFVFVLVIIFVIVFVLVFFTAALSVPYMMIVKVNYKTQRKRRLVSATTVRATKWRKCKPSGNTEKSKNSSRLNSGRVIPASLTSY